MNDGDDTDMDDFDGEIHVCLHGRPLDEDCHDCTRIAAAREREARAAPYVRKEYSETTKSLVARAKAYAERVRFEAEHQGRTYLQVEGQQQIATWLFWLGLALVVAIGIWLVRGGK